VSIPQNSQKLVEVVGAIGTNLTGEEQDPEFFVVEVREVLVQQALQKKFDVVEVYFVSFSQLVERVFQHLPVASDQSSALLRLPRVLPRTHGRRLDAQRLAALVDVGECLLPFVKIDYSVLPDVDRVE